MASIQDVIEEFEAKMKQVSPADLQMAKGETPVEEAVTEPAGEEPACVSTNFKQLVKVLPDKYIGSNFKDLLLETLETFPDCEG